MGFEPATEGSLDPCAAALNTAPHAQLLYFDVTQGSLILFQVSIASIVTIFVNEMAQIPKSYQSRHRNCKSEK
jgi:hypothetical protein